MLRIIKQIIKPTVAMTGVVNNATKNIQPETLEKSHQALYFIGMMSGTSLDGIDTALVKIKPFSLEIIDTLESTIPDALKQELSALCEAETFPVNRIAELDVIFGKLLGESAKTIINKHPQINVTAIGSHGQTIRHQTTGTQFSWQIGDPNTIAELTGVPVVGDFRRRDIAASGQGAPLACAFHEFAFGQKDQQIAVLNIGGMANITLISDGEVSKGFDTGPGNRLMDEWCLEHLGKTFDQDGTWAKQGLVNQQLLNSLLSDPYFSLEPPKSTGRELFNRQWLAKHLQHVEISAQDIQATLLALTVESIAQSIEQLPNNIDQLYICGGGARNIFLIEQMKQRLNTIKIGITDELGINADWVEAAAFAWLAHQTWFQLTGNSATVTGAKGRRILGGLYMGL